MMRTEPLELEALPSAPPGMLALPRVAARLSGSLTACLMDLGIGGLAIETPFPLTPRQRLRVHLGNGSRPLPTEIAWSNLHHTRCAAGDVLPVYRSGGSFVGRELREATARLDRLATAAGGRLQGRRFRRFSAPGSPQVRLELEILAAIRGLSPVGLLTEIPMPLETSTPWTLDLDLGGPVIRPRVRVTGCQPVAGSPRDPRWSVELEMVELEDDEARALGDFLRSGS